ncbi:MAG: serpin family protein [candidate division WOR-3 bacterium]|nr:MAG: serpin family protein [candidate division WOR-3 bacterium]
MFTEKFFMIPALIIFLSCGSAVSGSDEKSVVQQDINIVDAANQFSFELYGRLSENKENIFFSPYSIWTCLAMTYEGARAQTQTQMQYVLHMPTDKHMRRRSIRDLLITLNATDVSYQLSTANALWAQRDYAFLQEYTEIVTNSYLARVVNLDFKADTEGSRQTINDWVAQQTHQKIKDLLPPGALTALTRLVLTNAVYFKATWLQQFDEAQTTEQPFHTTPEDEVSVPMMSMMNTRFPYTETADAQILELPYSGDSLAMLIMLPRTHETAQLESMLDTAHLNEWTSRLSIQKVDVFLPRFTLETKYTLNTILGDMGMPTAFSPQADFSGMDGKGNLFISKVIHQAFVEVNEQGTEAAAATGIIMEMTVARPRAVFRADHPFIFMIMDKSTHAVLFMGRVNNPS